MKLDQSFKWLNHCYSRRATENNCAASKNNYITAWLQNTYKSLPKVLGFLAFEVSVQNLINKCKDADATGFSCFQLKSGLAIDITRLYSSYITCQYSLVQLLLQSILQDFSQTSYSHLYSSDPIPNLFLEHLQVACFIQYLAFPHKFLEKCYFKISLLFLFIPQASMPSDFNSHH